MTASRAVWMRRAGQWLGIAGVTLALLLVRVVVASHAELERAGTLAAEGRLDAAIVHYRRAAHWYAPGNPYVTAALGALADIGRVAEREGDRDRALFAWRSIRASILGARSFYVPHRALLDEADRQIASLMASLPPPPVDAGKTQPELEAEHLALLRDVRGPRIGWTVVLLLGFFGWVGGAFAFAARAIDEEDRLVRREAVRWAGVVAVGMALWLVGMALA